MIKFCYKMPKNGETYLKISFLLFLPKISRFFLHRPYICKNVSLNQNGLKILEAALNLSGPYFRKMK